MKELPSKERSIYHIGNCKHKRKEPMLLDFFMKPWVGPLLGAIGLLLAILNRSGVISTKIGDTLLILAVASAVGSYFTHKET